MLRFVGDGDQKKIHQKSPPFFNAKFPGKHEKKIFTKFFWRAGKVINSAFSLCFVFDRVHKSKSSFVNGQTSYCSSCTVAKGPRAFFLRLCLYKQCFEASKLASTN